MSEQGNSAALAVSRLDAYDNREIFGGAVDPCGVAEWGLVWRLKDHHFGIRADGRLVAHAGLVVLPVSVGGGRMDVVGVGGVGVAEDLRGRGLARQLMSGVMEHARGLGPDFAMLFCRPDVAGLYGGLGWRELGGEVEVEQPDGPAVMPLRTMWIPLREGAWWPEGPVRLHSRPM
ncbi:GNAT family N-acetyltransferase [Streptomyces sp. NPDC045456]|uniref:GNAT family N-acetyltransferase n=1 Tax=Streptomyces sp. NPDC045456 TaxID=3155254 RepID=UPI0033FA234D